MSDSTPVETRDARHFLKNVAKPWNDTQIDAVVRARGKCEYCGADLLSSLEAFWSSEWEHIIPQAMGGEDDYEKNIALACHTCNQIKGSLLPQGESAESLGAKGRSTRIDAYKSMITKLRERYQFAEVFAAFRRLMGRE